MAERNRILIDILTRVRNADRIDKLVKQLQKAEYAAKAYGNTLSSQLGDSNTKWKKHFDFVDKGVRAMGMGLTKFVGMAAKFATVQVVGLGAAMMAVHGAFVLGNASMKVFRGVAQLAAGAVAGLVIALSSAAAAMREQQAAMFAFKGTGKNEFGSGLNQIRVELRGLMTDASLAAVGAENLNAAFAAINKKGTYTQGAQALFKGLMDFASAGQDIKTGSKAAGELVATLIDPKANFSQITEAAKALGPQMEQALNKAKEKGIDTAAELKAAILDGSLATLGGVEGQFDAFNSTLINRGKAAFSQIKEMFADMGLPFLEPLKVELAEVAAIFRKTFIRVSGDIDMFARGNFIDNISVALEKVANFTADLIHDHLPKVYGMFDRMGEWWHNFKEGWNKILDTLRPLIDAAKVLEKMLMEVLRPVGDMLSEGFGELRDLIVSNEKEFVGFGRAIGEFIVQFSEFAGELREIFVGALPFLTKIVKGATQLFDIFTSVLGVLQKLTGGLGDIGPMILPLGMLISGRAMKSTIGGRVPVPGSLAQKTQTSTMSVDSAATTIRGGVVQVIGQTPSGGLPAAGQGLSNTTVVRGGETVTPGGVILPAGVRSGAGGGGGQVTGQTAAGAAGAAGAAASVGRMARLKEKWRLNTTPLSQLTEDERKALTKNGKVQNMRERMRNKRENAFTKKIFGGEIDGKPVKGINKSFGAGMAASMGLGMLSSSGMVGEEAQGALALGSAIGAFNPVAGLAVGLGGTALTSTTVGGGALSGAAAGATMGAFLGPGGALAGAAIGGLVGGIAGFINGDKKKRKEARQAGERAMGSLLDSTLEGMNANMRKLGAKGFTTANVKKQFDQLRTTFSEAANGVEKILGQDLDSDALKSWMQANRKSNPILAAMTDADFEKALKKPKDALTEILGTEKEYAILTTTIERKYSSRMNMFTDMMGKSEEEVIKLAEATGVNLMDATADTAEMIRALAEGMVDNFSDVQQSAGNAMSDIAMIFEKPLKQMEASAALDENFRNLRDRIDQGALVGEEGRAQVLSTFQNAIPQLIATKGGDTLAAMFEFQRLFNLQSGTAFSQKGGYLEGQAGNLGALAGPEIQQAVRDAGLQAGGIVSEFVTANLLKSNFQMDAGAAMQIRNRVASGQITESQANALMNFISTADLTQEKNRNALVAQLDRLGIDTAIKTAEGTIATAAVSFEDAAGTVKTAAEMIIKHLEPGDTRSRRAIGDTGSNLSRTMSAHNALNGQIPGRRIITSSYRNFALGSLKSDHLTGNALDLVGDNLVSYRDSVKRSGGFAEFHGGFGDKRHLHVVPNTNAIGDNGMQSSATTGSQSSSGGVAVYNTFNISGADGNKEELVQSIISRINASIRDARERS